jgi:guanylate kinase
MSARGSVLVVSAPSGAGKTTLCRRLLADLPGLEFSVSHTTRARRAAEEHGRDYFFVDRPEFERRREAGEFLEWATVAGHLYGTSAAAVRLATEAGKDVLLDIDTQGAAAVRRQMPDAVLIFILPPGPEALRTRLLQRGSETPADLERRLRLAAAEIDHAGLYDYLIVNEDLEAAYRDLKAVVLAARCRIGRQRDRLRDITGRFHAS